MLTQSHCRTRSPHRDGGWTYLLGLETFYCLFSSPRLSIQQIYLQLQSRLPLLAPEGPSSFGQLLPI